ncbi:MAG: hypothetical protein HY062_17865 [Bacteroidetes bacterium]|nr:hypothetical protein [Bacteroidota bacterium]
MKSTLSILISFFIAIFLYAFSPNNGNNGNHNGSLNYNSHNLDGVFSIYKYTRDFNFGQPAIDYKNYIAFFLQTRGDTTTKFFNGNLSFCNKQLIYSVNNKIYTFDDSNSNAVGNQKWNCKPINNNSIINYQFSRGVAKVEFEDQNKLKDTISINNILNINLDAVENADSVIITLTGFNGTTINKRVAGIAQNVIFTQSELSNLISGGIISVSALNILPVTINNKNYLFSSVHQYLKLVYFKN